MRAGNIDGIVSTSALELGVDIGSLDVVILNGYPGSVAATWQRFGRAGRRQQPALGVMVASSQPLDQYVVRHPDLRRSLARTCAHCARPAADPVRPYRCAAFELPFRVGDGFGPIDPEVFLEALAETEVIHREGERWEWIADSYPANAVSLRAADGNFVVVDRSDGRQQIIAEVDYPPPRDGFGPIDPEVFLEALAETEVIHREGERWEWIADSYPANAVSLRAVADGNFVVVDRSDGRQQIIAEVDYPPPRSPCTRAPSTGLGGRKAYVTRTHVDYYTDSIDFTKLKVLDRFDGGVAGRGDSHHGEVHVVRRVAGYKKIRYYTHENIGYGPVNLPDQELHTTAVWWQLPQALLLRAFASRQDALDGFLGAAYALHIVATVAVMADARDLQKSVGNGDGSWFAIADQSGRASCAAARVILALSNCCREFVPTVYLYDNFPGGVGLSEPLWQRQAELVQRARELVQRCDCKAGCPACVGPVLAAQEEDETSPRALALRVLDLFDADACQHVPDVVVTTRDPMELLAP